MKETLMISPAQPMRSPSSDNKLDGLTENFSLDTIIEFGELTGDDFSNSVSLGTPIFHYSNNTEYPYEEQNGQEKEDTIDYFGIGFGSASGIFSSEAHKEGISQEVDRSSIYAESRINETTSEEPEEISTQSSANTSVSPHSVYEYEPDIQTNVGQLSKVKRKVPGKPSQFRSSSEQISHATSIPEFDFAPSQIHNAQIRPKGEPSAPKALVKSFLSSKKRKLNQDLQYIHYDIQTLNEPFPPLEPLSSFRMDNNITISYFNPYHPGYHFRMNNRSTNYEPRVNRKLRRELRADSQQSTGRKKKCASRGNHALCPYCPIPTFGDDNLDKVFFKRNDSNYLHHMIQFHGIFSNGDFVREPSSREWALNPATCEDKIEVVKCPYCEDHGENIYIATKKFKTGCEKEHRLLKYLRHVKEYHDPRRPNRSLTRTDAA